MTRMMVSRFEAVGLVAVGLVEPIEVFSWSVRVVRVVEPAVAQVLEEMFDDLDQTVAAAGRSVSAHLDALVEHAEMMVRGHDRGDLDE